MRRARYVSACLVVLTLFGCLMVGLLAWRLWHNEKRRLLMETLERGGAFVAYEYQLKPLPSGVAADPDQPPGPGWLREILGQDFFAGEAFVWVPNPSSLSSEQLVFPLWHVRQLRLSSAQLNEVDLRRLRWLKGLEALSLEGTEATDEHLRLIAKFQGLRELILNRTKVTDRGLAYLKGLKHLEVLEVDQGDHPRITDAGARHLEDLTQLRFLRLSADRLSEEAVERLYRALGKEKIILCYHGGFDPKKVGSEDPGG